MADLTDCSDVWSPPIDDEFDAMFCAIEDPEADAAKRAARARWLEQYAAPPVELHRPASALHPEVVID